MSATKALLVFCEGPHDVAFVKNVLKYCFNAEKAKGSEGDGLKFSEYPAPFNQFFRTSVENHAAKDLSLDMAHKFFLPDHTLVKDDTLILLFNAGGARQIDKVKLFLKNFIPLHKEASTFPQDAVSVISEVKYLFLYDADHNVPDDVATKMQHDFSVIDDTEWEISPWNINSDNVPGVIQNDKALYVWAGEDGKGTLENILFPVYMETDSDLLNKSQTFVDETFSWNYENKPIESQFKKKAEKLKATICSAGQGKKPGRPLSAIIHDNVLGNKDAISQAKPVRDFVDFIHEFTQLKKAV